MKKILLIVLLFVMAVNAFAEEPVDSLFDYDKYLLENEDNVEQYRLKADSVRVKEKSKLPEGIYHFGFDVASAFFTGTAGDKMIPPLMYGLYFSLCASRYCIDAGIYSNLFYSNYKEDIEQSGNVYPKEAISYTTPMVAFMYRGLTFPNMNMFYFFGWRQTALEVDDSNEEKYGVKKRFGGGYSNAFATGIVLDFFKDDTYIRDGIKYHRPSLWGVRFKLGIAREENERMDFSGFAIFTSLGLFIRV